MRKAMVLSFAVIVLVTSALAVGHPGSLLSPFMSTSSTMAGWRLGIAAFVLLAGLWAAERGKLLRALTGLMSGGLLLTGLILVLSPTLMGRLSYFVLPFDILIFIEAGVLSGISALLPQ